MMAKSVDFDNVSCYSSTTSRSQSTILPGIPEPRDITHRLRLAEREQRRVAISKVAMILLFIAVASGLSTATFIYVRNEEEDDFYKKFETDSSEIISVATANVKTAFLALEAFSNSISGYVKDTNMTWPNITIGDYTSKAHRTLKLAGTGKVIFCPFVEVEDRLGFEEYARENILGQIQDNFDYFNTGENASDIPVADVISYSNITTKERHEEPYNGPLVTSEYLVNWQSSFFTPTSLVMNNILRVPTIESAAIQAKLTKFPKVSFLYGLSGVLMSQVIQPIYQDIFPPEQASKREVMGILWMPTEWGSFFLNILHENEPGPRVVLESSCGITVTYQINGLESEFVGEGNMHDPKYSDMEIVADFLNLGLEAVEEYPDDICFDHLTLRFYPTDTMKASTTTGRPAIYTVVVASIFLCTSMMFMIYDWAVRRRQSKVMDRVLTQDKIVSNLFPASIRDRLYHLGDRGSAGSGSVGAPAEFLNDCDVNNASLFGAKPIADLFLETTVMFADIAGFTAWSSAREPSQVFILLENVYGAFDKLCHRYGVFKVETIGDCYVAVTGLPQPTKDHAIIMAKFARDCMSRMDALTAKMEIALGPDTCDLDIRIGLHSGQVTAGVLRGERSRFQLFGDTVNVAARMESTGERRRIQMSNTTAELVRASYSKWVHSRGSIVVHGKGTMHTYWLETKEESEERREISRKAHARGAWDRGNTVSTSEDHDESEGSLPTDEEELEEEEELLRGANMSKKQRLVEWNVEILGSLLKRILAARMKRSKSLTEAENQLKTGQTVLEEFEEIITLPKVTMDDLQRRKDPADIMLDDKVNGQLRRLLTNIADMYNENAFHSFEHASHVTASVAKLLSRIVTSDTTQQTQGPKDIDESDLAGHSYGITSDPLTQFAVVFSAIIHDVDHPGVPNTQLMKEGDPMVTKYKGKSLAEQNSVDLTWDLLLRDEYADLRACIYCDETELKRFRQLLVNMVMATDIADKELGALRKARWNKAFSVEPNQQDTAELAMNRKATIVLEHLIQASDVAHTMQHWQVYKTWNQKFFNECYSAWREGRADKDPSVGWYEGEIGFFDFYIIPLAMKLDSCGVFGVSSHEYLNYANANKEEWIRTGKEVVQGFVATYNSKCGNTSSSKSNC